MDPLYLVCTYSLQLSTSNMHPHPPGSPVSLLAYLPLLSVTYFLLTYLTTPLLLCICFVNIQVNSKRPRYIFTDLLIIEPLPQAWTVIILKSATWNSEASYLVVPHPVTLLYMLTRLSCKPSTSTSHRHQLRVAQINQVLSPPSAEDPRLQYIITEFQHPLLVNLHRPSLLEVLDLDPHQPSLYNPASLPGLNVPSLPHTPSQTPSPADRTPPSPSRRA